MAAKIVANSFRALCIAGALTCTTATRAAVVIYQATLTGPSESPPNASPGTGNAIVTIDTTANTMSVFVTFSGLQGTTTASHIHATTTSAGAGTAGVATTVPTFPGFPLGVTAGTYNPSPFDLLASSTYNPAFVAANGGTTAGAEAALLSALASGKAYLNIHTSAFPGGEIRGFLSVPEPATWALMLLGFGGIGIAFRRRERSFARC